MLWPETRPALEVDMDWALLITEMPSLAEALTPLGCSEVQSMRRQVATMGKQLESLGLVGRCRAISMPPRTRPCTQIITIRMRYQATKASSNTSPKPRRCSPSGVVAPALNKPSTQDYYVLVAKLAASSEHLQGSNNLEAS